MKSDFGRGVRTGIPICLGYLSVSFGFGIMAVQKGLNPWIAVLISLTNLTSAGQAAGVEVIAAAGGYLELVLTQVLINARYSLMGLSLTQKAMSFRRGERMLVSYGITDEIFGAAYGQKGELTPPFMYGMILISTLGWVSGTFLGAFSGDILPARLSAALGILLYGMFIAIIIPPIRSSRSNLAAILIAAAISCVIYYCLPMISSGFSIIISAVIASALLAVLAPVKEEEEEENA